MGVLGRRKGAAAVKQLRRVICLGVCMALAGPGYGAVVALQPPAAAEGDIVVPVAVYPSGDEAVAGVQFDVNFDGAAVALIDVEAGAAALDAGKFVIHNEGDPGTTRVIIAGLNQDLIGDGIVANLVFRPLDAGASSDSFALNAPVLSDPFGGAVEVHVEYATDAAEEPSGEKRIEEPEASSETASETGAVTEEVSSGFYDALAEVLFDDPPETAPDGRSADAASRDSLSGSSSRNTLLRTEGAAASSGSARPSLHIPSRPVQVSSRNVSSPARGNTSRSQSDETRPTGSEASQGEEGLPGHPSGFQMASVPGRAAGRALGGTPGTANSLPGAEAPRVKHSLPLRYLFWVLAGVFVLALTFTVRGYVFRNPRKTS